VAVIGSGPAGLAAAAELNRCGHLVSVYERDEAPGGLMRFGVPDAKLEKQVIDRRVEILEQEGIQFIYDTEIGSDLAIAELQARHDAVVIAIGSRVSRDVDVPGRDSSGIHFAMDYLYQRNRWVAQHENRRFRAPEPGSEITAAGKRVIVIGGGDTGMDCISNALREGAESAKILDVYAELLESDPRHPWPLPPKRTLTTYAIDEGGERRWGTEVTGFGAKDGKVTHVYARKVTGSSSRDLTPVPGSEFVVEADLVLIAIGFTHPEHEGFVGDLQLNLDERGNISTRQTYMTSHPSGRIFSCGDARIGQSLVVTAIFEGRQCARVVNGELGGAPMDQDRELLALGAWSGEYDGTLRHEAEAAGTVRPGEQFFTGPGSRTE
jgi:glutamate synthase (NADPH/NADH) small chain